MYRFFSKKEKREREVGEKFLTGLIIKLFDPIIRVILFCWTSVTREAIINVDRAF